MKSKSDVGQRFSSQRGGCGIGGCLGIGCLVIFLLIGAAGIGGYYSLMHTNLPLQLIESTIEQSGDVEIDGLDGTLSDGFSAEEFRFKTNSEEWSSLNDINVKYESKSSFFSGSKFILDDVSVKSGTIYAQWDPEEQQIDLTPDFDDGSDEGVNFSLNGNKEEGEILVKNISVDDLEVINTDADVSIKIDQAKISNFHMKDGELLSFGELTVASNQVDIKTTPSAAFDPSLNLDIESRFEGTVKADIDSRLEKDFAFSLDYGMTSDMKTVHVFARLFDGAMIVSDTPDDSTVEYKSLNLTDYVSAAAKVMTPTEINFRLLFDEHDQSIKTVSKNGSLKFGNTKFTNVRPANSEELSDVLICDGVVDKNPITFSFTVSSPFSPWKSLKLSSPSFEGTANDLWAKTYFGQAFDELDVDQQAMIEEATWQSKSPQDEPVEAETDRSEVPDDN